MQLSGDSLFWVLITSHFYAELNVFYETCFWFSIRGISKAFEPRLLIYNGLSSVDDINSVCCFS